MGRGRSWLVSMIFRLDLTLGKYTKSILGSGDLKTAFSGLASTCAIITDKGKFWAPPKFVSYVKILVG